MDKCYSAKPHIDAQELSQKIWLRRASVTGERARELSGKFSLRRLSVTSWLLSQRAEKTARRSPVSTRAPATSEFVIFRLAFNALTFEEVTIRTPTVAAAKAKRESCSGRVHPAATNLCNTKIWVFL